MLSAARWLLVSLAVAFCATAIGACGRDVPRGLPPPPRISDDGGAGGEFEGVPEECTPPVGGCGYDVTKVVLNAPNIYFIFDRSGSMAEASSPGGMVTRYSVVRSAAIDMVASLGTLINVGAALFPGSDSGCDAGREVLAISPGDPDSANGSPSSTTAKFTTVTSSTPSGGTPISATLEALLPVFEAAEGRTVALLLTDGGPNCNPAESCGPETCQPVIEGTCPDGENCCSTTFPGGGPELCIDRQATIDAVAAVAALGVEIYIIGIPGSEIYQDVLDAMAVAAGTAQSGPTQYHQVVDLAALGELFGNIAGEAISWEIPLSERPSEDDLSFTNVYLDCELLPFDPVKGWTWLEGHKVWLHGEACQRLKQGDVSQVHIAIGCPTELPK